MRKLLGWVAALCVVCGCAKQEDAWVPFASSEGRFSVLMPETPSQSQASEATATSPVARHFFRASRKEPHVLSVGVEYSDLPVEVARDPRQVLREATGDGLADPGERVLERRDITLGPHPGVEIVMTTPVQSQQVTTRLRVFLVGSRLYQVKAGSLEPEAVSDDVNKFLDSFQITP